MPQIKTFCRIKPTAEYYPEFEVSRDTLYLRVPEVLRDFTSNKGRGAMINHEFHFNYIFNNTATQEEVFDVAAKDIVKGFLNGFNGTIFAYGQTGTGKTYTVEGSPKQYSQRGIEPRALSMIYKELEQRQNEDISVHVSYLEIYQEVGYDLLSPGARTQSLVTPLPRVSVLEGNAGVWFVRNLSVHYAASEEVAQNLLIQGQANRRVAATTVHDRSSRSHAVFTLQLSAKQPDSDVIVKSKLHLVDLAGSERVAKTGVEGHLLSEAKSINLSLHFLETVIISLQGSSNPSRSSSLVDLHDGTRDSSNIQRPYTSENGRRFIPYRNSLLTMVLRDSLGGNCLTAMIATLSLEIDNLGESISTCRFAGRVACIANSVSRNEEVDEKTLIKRLRKRVAELETELACVRVARESETLNINEMSAKLTDEDKILCSKVVQRYILGELMDPVTAGITSPYKFRECLKILKRIIVDGKVSMPTENLEALENGYHGANETHTNNSKKYQSKTSADILKVHSDTNNKLHREKTVDFPITNAWETPAPEPRPSPAVKKTPQKPKAREIPVVDDANYHTDNEESRLPTGESHQTSSSDPLKQERSLAALLTSKRRKYKSPFEQRREKEIKKLNNKVEKMQQEQIEKEGELVEMKLGLADQELHLVEEQLRNKLNVTKEQVADQHAYVAQLQTTEADPKLIEQEQLVEQQLRKRQQKFDKKLEEIDEKKLQLQQHSEEFAAELQNVPKPSLKEQYGKYRKKDGSLNTRQVFEMLKTQEKKQEKVHTEIDQERAWVFSKHLEMREAATRQKLQQFKEMLRMSKTAGVRDRTGASWDRDDKVPITAPANMSSHPGQYKTSPSDEENDVPPTRQTHMSQEEEIPVTKQTHKSHVTDPPLTRQTERTNFTAVNFNDLPVTRQTVRTEYTNDVSEFENVPSSSQTNRSAGQSQEVNNTRPMSSKSIRSVPDPDFYAARKQQKDPTARWESSYSRPSTSCSNRLPDDKGDNFSLVNGNVGTIDDVKLASRKSERTLGYEYEPEVVNLNNGYNSEQDVQDTLMPSEYVYGMGTREKFDGRRMGLTSKTFDAALASMLDKENQNVYFEQDDYDQYARTSYRKPKIQYENPYLKNNPYREKLNSPPKSQLRPRGRSRERKTFSREQQMWNLSDDDDTLERVYGRRTQSKSRESRERHTRERSKSQDRYHQDESPLELWASQHNKWGPEAKHASIHSKLGLQTPERKVRKPRKKRAKRSLEQNLADYDKKILPSSDAKLLIEEQKMSRVTALPEVQAEDVFMSKVQEQKDRVSKIRQARRSAEIIQRAWRKYLAHKNKS